VPRLNDPVRIARVSAEPDDEADDGEEQRRTLDVGTFYEAIHTVISDDEIAQAGGQDRDEYRSRHPEASSVHVAIET
jgi:hypothetical protein